MNTEDLLHTLEKRFHANMLRHNNTTWLDVKNKLIQNTQALRVIGAMEQSGGEPDVVSLPNYVQNIVFVDCSTESPKERRSLCYDNKALEMRKENKPKGSAITMADEMGVQILTEEEYQELQKYGEFDTKTSSWLLTPSAIRMHGGALFGDRRYNHVFTYHNGADSYYAARGFRTKFIV